MIMPLTIILGNFQGCKNFPFTSLFFRKKGKVLWAEFYGCFFFVVFYFSKINNTRLDAWLGLLCLWCTSPSNLLLRSVNFPSHLHRNKISRLLSSTDWVFKLQDNFKRRNKILIFQNCFASHHDFIDRYFYESISKRNATILLKCFNFVSDANKKVINT